MTILSQAVIDAGARVGRIVKYYETVAELIASTDTVADGEFVQAGQYFYEGAGDGASDQDIRMNSGSGSKLYCIANPYVTPDQFGAPAGTADATTAVQAAVSSGKPVFLNRIYRVSNIYFPTGVSGVAIVGASMRTSGLYGNTSSAECVLQTFEPGDGTETGHHSLSNFIITGAAKRGLAVCHVTNSRFENLNFVGFNASGPSGDTTGLVVEQSFSNMFTSLHFGYGCKVDIRVGQTVLDTVFEKVYTSNAYCMHHFEIDSSRRDMAEAYSPGNGLVYFNNCTVQGSRSYAIKMRGQSEVGIRDLYIEGAVASLLVKDVDLLNLYGGVMSGDSSAHGVWLDQTEGASTLAVQFHGSLVGEVVVGKVYAVGFYGAKFEASGGAESSIFKTNSSYKLKDAMSVSGSEATQITSIGEYKASSGGTMLLKCSDGSQNSRVSVNSSGTVSGAAAFSYADVDHYPHSPVVWWTASYTPTWPSGVAITPVTVGCVGGTSPYTFAIQDDKRDFALPPGISLNSSTGEVSGTPTTPGTYYFKIRATDSRGTYGFWDDTAVVTVTVT